MSSPVAFVTGAGRGIGAAAVAALAAQGWSVVALDSCRPHPLLAYPLATEADLDGVVKRSAHTIGVVGDVTQPAELAAAVETTLTTFGRLDAVVCAAGVVAGGSPAWEVTDEEWAAVISTDLTGVFNTVKACVSHLLAAPAGRVVTVASAAGSLGLRLMAPYAAAKHGVIGFTRSLAADLSATGVTANVVSPGSTATAGLEESARIYGVASTEDFVRYQEPLGRLIQPAEVAAAIVWLCAASSAAITGAVIPVDGGMTATP